MDRRSFLAAAGTGVSISLAGCLGIGGGSSGDHDVGMTIDSFRPETLTVEPGYTVEFVNTSDHAHTVTAFDGGVPEGADYFASGGYDDEETAVEAWDAEFGGALYTGDSYERTFEVPGRYEYYCIPHIRSDMVGTIVVE